MSAPTLINLPPPRSDPATPTETGPGTPGSTTTSMSELSTVAIKDGHRGHGHTHTSTRDARAFNPLSDRDNNTLDAERADRISRLPGLERAAVVRSSSSASLPPGASARNPQGYFDAPIPPTVYRERSTVGSASATGSVGGRTTWASSSDQNDPDRMSEDLESNSADGFSEEGNGSLFGFGDGASSTVSGPISTSATAGSRKSAQRQSGMAPNSPHKVSAVPAYLRAEGTQAASGTAPNGRDARMMEGLTYD